MKICVTFVSPQHCTKMATVRNYEVDMVLAPVILGKSEIVPVLN
jgi:hypothetical protein